MPNAAGEANLADDFVAVIDGIGPTLAAALADVGIITLADLAGASLDTLVRSALTGKEAAQFQSIAGILLANASLRADDAEVLVVGMGISGAGELSRRLGELTSDRVLQAAATSRTPVDWSADRLLALAAGEP